MAFYSQGKRATLALQKTVPVSMYQKKMDRLSKRIFGENVHPVRDAKDEKVVRFFKCLPLEQDERYTTRYYPPHPMFHFLTKVLRLHGVFRDEHEDFKEEIQRLRALRGKGRPRIGEGKRATMRKTGEA